jgi:hypothetical protein
MRNFIIASMILVPAISSGFELRKDATGSPVSWKSDIEFIFDARARDVLGDPQAFASAKAALETIAAMVPGHTVTIREGTVHEPGYDTSPGAQNQNQIIVQTNWQYQVDTTATTFLTVDEHSHKIIHADVVLNAQYRKFKALPANSTPGGQYEDLQNILTHEFGHAFGLDHNSNDASVVMFPLAPTGEISKRLLAEDDKAGLRALYPIAEAGAHEAQSHAPQVGCSSAANPLFVWMALIALPILLRRRQTGSLARL